MLLWISHQITTTLRKKSEKLSYMLKHRVYTTRETIGVKEHRLISSMLQWAALDGAESCELVGCYLTTHAIAETRQSVQCPITA